MLAVVGKIGFGLELVCGASVRALRHESPLVIGGGEGGILHGCSQRALGFLLGVISFHVFVGMIGGVLGGEMVPVF